MKSPLPGRFWAKVAVAESGCWEWTASVDALGYGKFAIGNGRWWRAYRVAYEALVGPVPEGLELDHLCRNPACVNPLHLEPVTHRDNVLRGNAPGAVATRTNRCRKGHVFTPENTAIYRRPDGTPYRLCRTCKRTRARENDRRYRGTVVHRV